MSTGISPNVNAAVVNGARPVLSNAPASFRTADLSKYKLSHKSRPMLAREADSVYWMSRYIERAEHMARMLRIKMAMLADSGDLEESLVEGLWRSIPQVARLGDDVPLPANAPDAPLPVRIAAYMTFNPANPNSLINCLTRARENARSVRETISTEMWEEINAIYWSLRAEEAQRRFEESPDAYLSSVLSMSMLFQGMADQTMRHDQRWQFTQLGKYVERIDFTCRAISHHWTLLTAAESEMDQPLLNIHWMGLLRTCCSIEAYRKTNLGELDGLRVTSFLTLERNFPRAIRYAVAGAYEAISAIRAESDAGKGDAAERILGRLDAQLEYAEVSELLAEGVPQYLGRIEYAIFEVAQALQKGYFLH
jgi:uncharacterized alpha-E superfamily protein